MAPRKAMVCLVVGLWLFSGNRLPAEKLADLSEVLRPFFITAAQGRMYVTEEQPAVHIYRLGNQAGFAEFVKTFGRQGAGGTLFFFYQGFYFYLKENLDAEVWELYREKVF